MKTAFILLWMSFCLLHAFCVQSSDVTIKKIEDETDLPEQFCTVWEPGDYYVSDGGYLIIFGASSRPLRLNSGNYATDNAMGSILSFTPAGQSLRCDMVIGSPSIRLKGQSIDGDEPGYSRTYVRYKGEKGKALNTRTVLEAIKKGHSFATNAPILDLLVKKNFKPGELCPAADGEVDIRVRVQSALWVSVDEVRTIINAERKIIFPVKTESAASVKFDEHVILTLDRDSTIIAEVLGKKSLYPVVQAVSRDGALEDAVLPYALTNPVFVDVDGNGMFDPPRAQKIEPVEITGEKTIIAR